MDRGHSGWELRRAAARGTVLPLDAQGMAYTVMAGGIHSNFCSCSSIHEVGRDTDLRGGSGFTPTMHDYSRFSLRIFHVIMRRRLT